MTVENGSLPATSCPIPKEHLRLLYHAFKEYEMSASAAADFEKPCVLFVQGTEKHWRLEFWYPSENRRKQADFYRDKDMWEVYQAAVAEARGLGDRAVISTVVAVVTTNAEE